MVDLSRWTGSRAMRQPQNELEGWLGNTLFNGLLNAESFAQAPWPKTDIYEDPEGVRLQFEVPGIDSDQVKVQVNDHTLTISGERKLENEEHRSNWHRVESARGAFERSFSLPPAFDTEKVSADYKNGVLTVRVPRSERAKPRAVQVKVESK